jgi:hypothetical protein
MGSRAESRPVQKSNGSARSEYRGLLWDRKHRGWRVRIFYGAAALYVCVRDRLTDGWWCCLSLPGANAPWV